MAEKRRIDRLGQQLRAEIGAIIENSLADPRIGIVNVTHVRLSSDMRNARVFVTGAVGGEDDRRKMLEGLVSAHGFLRRQLSQRLPHLRRIPELSFTYDDDAERGLRVEELLERLHNQDQ